MNSAVLQLLQFWLVFSLKYLNHGAAFTIAPSSQEVEIGEQATFRCQHVTAYVILWRLDDILVGSSLPSGVSRSVSSDETGNVFILTVSGSREYNRSVIECVAGFLNGSSEVSHPAYLTVLPTYFTKPPYDSDFLVIPSPLTVAIGTKGKFRCQHSTADIVSWRINGTSLGSFHPKDVTTEGVATPDGLYHVLTIGAVAAYNGTFIECVAIFFDDSAPELTPAVPLLIQGLLDPVSDISLNISTSISLSWQPPDSLNLSYVEPDIVYCVDVFKITCGIEQVLSKFDFTQSYFYYNVNDPDPRDIYQFVITPRSNVVGAINGTASEPITGWFMKDVSVKTMLEFKPVLNVTVIVPMMDVDAIVPSRESCYRGQYVVSLWSVDDGAGLQELENTNCSTAAVPIDDVTIHLTLDCELDVRRVCKCHLFYQMPLGGVMSNVSIANNFELSTHDIQNVNASAMSDQIHLNYSYAKGSTAKGLLAIAHSEKNFHCVVAERKDDLRLMSIIDGLDNGSYYVSVFVVDERGIPLNRSSSLQRSVTIQKNSTTKMCQALPSELGIEAIVSTLDSNPLNRSVHCIFHSEELSGCVVIIHPVAHASLENNVVVSIKVHYVSRDGDKASVNVTLDSVDDHLAVFAYNKEKRMIYGNPVNFTSDLKCMDLNAHHLHIIIGTVVTIIVFTCICLTSLIVISVKKAGRKIKFRYNCDLHCQLESNGKSIVLERITNDIKPQECNTVITLETPVECSDNHIIKDPERYQVSDSDPLRSMLLASIDSTRRPQKLDSGMYDIVYVSESNVVLGTSNSYPQVKVFGVLVEEPMVPEGHCLPTQDHCPAVNVLVSEQDQLKMVTSDLDVNTEKNQNNIMNTKMTVQQANQQQTSRRHNHRATSIQSPKHHLSSC